MTDISVPGAEVVVAPEAPPVQQTSERGVITVEIDRPIPHPDNPRRGDVNAIARSLERFGQVKPIIVQRSTGYVVAGNHTLMAAKQLGWRTIRVSVAEMDDQTARAYLIADNRTSDRGEYSKAKLYDMLGGMVDELESTGWSDEEVSDLGASLGIEEEWDGDPEIELDQHISEVEKKYDPLRQLPLAIPTSEMNLFTDQIASLQKHWNTKTTTDTIRRVVNIAFDALPEPEEGFKQPPASTRF